MSARPAPPVSPAVRHTTVAAVVVVALVAAVVSYAHMQTVADRAGEGWRAWLIPASVDGLIVAASMVLLVRRRAGLPGGWLAWTALLGGVAASLACNVAAAQPTVTARLLAAWPPLAFAAAFELLLQQRRTDPTRPAPAAQRGVSAPVATAPISAATAPPRPQVGSSPADSRTATTVAGAAPARPLVPLVPAQQSGPDRSGFVPAVGSPDRSNPPFRTGPTRTAQTVPPGRPAGRSAPTRADRSGVAPRNGSLRTGPGRTDAELTEAVRVLAERHGRTPSAYQVKNELGVGSARAARLLAELDTTTDGHAPEGRH